MTNESIASDQRISSWTQATGTKPGERFVYHWTPRNMIAPPVGHDATARTFNYEGEVSRHFARVVIAAKTVVAAQVILSSARRSKA